MSSSSVPVPQGSQTAIGVAGLRLAHQKIDGEPKILHDPVIGRLIGRERTEAERALIATRLRTPEALSLRSHVVLRSRWAEDCLSQAVATGVRQYLILGAGLDTFAYRQPAWAADLTIFEIDRSESQAEKRHLLAQAAIEAPANVQFVPINFENTDPFAVLPAAGFRADQPVFLAWLGVTMYLTRTAVIQVLTRVAHLAPGSQIALTFTEPNPAGSASVGRAEAAATALGEPWLSRFTDNEMAQILTETGFSRSRFPTRASIDHTYFAGRIDGLKTPNRLGLVLAEV